jgi:uncharacterized protein YprB with RNaseH-like and TPR domain
MGGVSMPYLVVDIETCPIELDKYLTLNEEERKKYLNPIDSKIIALGIRSNKENKIFLSENEKEILENFWIEWSTIRKGNPSIPVVGFNINNFDMPFIVARSFINNVVISPFTLKQIVDLRDKINAYKYGEARGKLKEYAKLLGIEILDVDGSDVAQLCKNKEYEKLGEYLCKDLEITDALYIRAVETNISKIDRW